MENSIENAEKLIHTTNSALAQMKYNMPFDDLFKDFSADSSVFLEKLRHNRRRKKDTILPIQEELEKLENEVRADTNNILSSMDDLLNPEQYLTARQQTNQPEIIEKIHEINRKIEKRRQEIAKNEKGKNETPKPKLKPKFQFENEISTEETNLKPEVLPKKQISTPNLAESDKSSQISLNRTFTISRPKKSVVSEDLKKNILQAEEVVDRGFKTARQLKQKLDFLTKNDKKASSCEKISLSSKSLEHVSPRSVVSAETVKSLDVRKSRNADEAKETRRKKKREKHRDNVSVFDVKYTECRRHHGKKLKLQRLPSLQIGNGLRLQKIPSIDIPPQEVVETPVVGNAVVKNIVYGEDKIEKENLITDDVFNQKAGGRFVECTHCGKGIKVFDYKIEPDDVDELLLKCDFDVFDPRIDEFVENEFLGKHRCAKKVEVKESVADGPRKDKKREKKEKQKIEKENSNKELSLNVVEHKFDAHKEFTKLSDLGEDISRRYKEKTMKIENDYLEFEGILRDIFKKVDESREVFEGTQYLSILERERNLKRLSATKPVVVALGNPNPVPATDQVLKENVPVKSLEEIKFVNNISKEKNTIEKVKLNNEKKIEEKDRHERYKRLEEIRRKSIPSPKSSSGSDDPNPPPLMKFIPGSRNIFPNSKNKILENKGIGSPKVLTPKEKLPELNEVDEVGKSSSENSESDTSSSSDRALKVEENSKQSSKNNDVKTDEDYQSDFEVESIENSIELPLELESNTQIIEFSTLEDRDRESNRYVNRLPTISEKDSEMEKKISSSSVSVSELTSEKVSEKAESLPKEIEKIGDIPVNIEKNTEDASNKSNYEELKTDQILPLKNHDNLVTPKTFIGLSLKEKPENKLAHPDPDFSKFEKKVDEGLQKALDKAFENGVSYMLKRQQDIIDFNYKATRRKNIPKKNKYFKKPDVDILSYSSGSDTRVPNDFQLRNYPKEKNKIESSKKSTVESQPSPKSDLKSSTDQNTQMNSAKNNQDLTITHESTSKEMVNSLKELLDVLKTQFAKTEILTDKLTENVKEKKDQKEEKVENLKTGIILSSLNPLENSKYVNNIIFSNLQRSRKDLASSTNKKSRNIYTQCIEEGNSPDIISRSKFLNLSPKNLDAIQFGLPVAEKVTRKNIEKSSPSGISNFSYSSRDDRSLSVGEVLGTKSLNDPMLSFRKRKGKSSSSENSSVSESNSLQIKKSSRVSKNKNGRERYSPKISPEILCVNDSISEGEVPSCGLVDNKYDSSQSIGEVISEQISAESLDEDTSK